MPKVSIIVPVYNVEKYLPQCMDSLLNQTFEDIEIVLVDDGSLDNCPKMCDDYAKQDTRVKVIHKKNAGPGFARNSGIEMATGDYITFCDSDDFIEKDTVESIYYLMQEKNLCQIFYKSVRYNDGDLSCLNKNKTIDIVEGRDRLRHLALGIFDKPKGDIDIQNHYIGSACMSLYKRNILVENNIRFHNLISEDYLFNFEYLQYTKRIGFLKTTFYHYRITPGSRSHTIKVEKIITYCQYIESLLHKYGYSEDARQYAWGNFIRFFRSVSQMKMLEKGSSMKEKRDWYKYHRNLEYHKTATANYNSQRMSIKNYAFFLTHKHDVFITHYVVVIIADFIKRIVGRDTN